MLMIRLSRVGKKKYPTYKIVVQEKSKDPWGKTLEFLGNYNPHTKKINAKEERIKYWLSVGAQMSATLNNLLVREHIIEAKKMKAAKLNKKKNGEAKKTEKTNNQEEKKNDEKKSITTEQKEDKPENKKEEKINQAQEEAKKE